MSRVRPHALFDIWRADEAAECLEGLPPPVCTFLWEHIVPLQRQNTHDPDHPNFEEEPTYHSPLKQFWSRLPLEYQRQLNAAAERQDQKIGINTP